MYPVSIGSLWEARNSDPKHVKAKGRIDLPFAVTLIPGTIVQIEIIPDEKRTKDTSPHFRLCVVPEGGAR